MVELGVESNRPTTLTPANDTRGKASGYVSVSGGVGCKINTCGEKEHAVKNKETACSPKEKDRTVIQNTATFPFKNGFSRND